jgi:hypothetical protein
VLDVVYVAEFREDVAGGGSLGSVFLLPAAAILATVRDAFRVVRDFLPSLLRCEKWSSHNRRRALNELSMSRSTNPDRGCVMMNIDGTVSIFLRKFRVGMSKHVASQLKQIVNLMSGVRQRVEVGETMWPFCSAPTSQVTHPPFSSNFSFNKALSIDPARSEVRVGDKCLFSSLNNSNITKRRCEPYNKSCPNGRRTQPIMNHSSLKNSDY